MSSDSSTTSPSATAANGYLNQFRTTISELGRLPPETLSPATRDALLSAFHDWHTT